ncbi:hypothetical protein WJX74_004340 [Apatococcus lobatus]|uniref:Uncharacterized protein n=1 Tax=Apatococcus lobatus TaxID=904363 RepID=A0AAW1R049_9CHLO
MTCPCSASRRLASQRRAKKSSRRRPSRTASHRRRPTRKAGGRRRRARQSATAYGIAAGGLLPSGTMGARRLGVSSPYPGAAAPYATGSVGRLNYTPYP